MTVKALVSPVQQAYSKAVVKAGQPWFPAGTLLMSFGVLAWATARIHGLVFLYLPFLGLEFVGVVMASFGTIRMFRWKKANPLSQFDQGACS